MEYPYETCSDCVAVPFCKKLTNEVPVGNSDWCSSHYKLYKALALSELPKRYYKANMFNFKLTDVNTETHKKLSNITSDIVTEITKGSNALFLGAISGTGKTYGACTILNHYIYKTCLTEKFDLENPVALFVAYTSLIDDLRYSEDEFELHSKLAIVMNVPLLILDDVGVTNSYK